MAGLFRSMRTTENAVEAYCQGANGTVLALDEIKHADGKVVGRMIYSIASGTGKGRMTANATLRQSYQWRTFALLSAENSLEAEVRKAGGEWMPGMSVRIANIDITGVNNRVPKQTLAAIAQISKNYGHAGPKFVRALVDAGMHQNIDDLRQRVNTAAEKIAGKDADSPRIRAATSFALVLVAGEMAKQFGILPANTDVKKAVLWGWAQFADTPCSNLVNPEEKAIERLRNWIAQRWGVSIRHINDSPGHHYADAWFDDATVYLPTDKIDAAIGGGMTDTQFGKTVEKLGLISKRKGPDRIALSYVSGIGKVQCYALRRDLVGRTGTDMEGESKVVSIKGMRS
jgi:hypothetical protein